MLQFLQFKKKIASDSPYAQANLIFFHCKICIARPRSPLNFTNFIHLSSFSVLQFNVHQFVAVRAPLATKLV